jgi:hypothetical protein
MVTNKTRQERGVSHCGLVIYIKKKHLKGEGIVIKTQLCYDAKIYFEKNPLKKTKILQAIITL